MCVNLADSPLYRNMIIQFTDNQNISHEFQSRDLKCLVALLNINRFNSNLDGISHKNLTDF